MSDRVDGRARWARFATLLLGCLAALMLWGAPARAAWVEVSSEHFVIYGDQKANLLQEFAERLELYHAALARAFNRSTPPPSPSNRVTIFVVPDSRTIRELVNSENRFVGAVYLPRAGQPLALVPKLNKHSEFMLLHEYAHHFMWFMTPLRYPHWFTEGFAEFFGSALFTNESVALGAPADVRVLEFAVEENVPMHDLLHPTGGESFRAQRYNTFYAQAWLLFHYLIFEPSRAGQLTKYERLLASGKPGLEAAAEAFGDFKQLQMELERYIKRRTLPGMRIPKSELKLGPITARVLPPAEAAIMPVRIQSLSGVTPEEAAAVVLEARRVAAAHPDNAVVLSALAEAEADAKNFDAAIAAADRAIALDPNRIHAYIWKGHALAGRIEAAKLPAEAWKDVRVHWARTNRIEPDNPIPLFEFYDTFRAQGVAPTENAILGLERALEIAPFDGDLRWSVAQQMVADGRLVEAAATLGPLAYGAHENERTEAASKLLDEVNEKIAAQAGETSKASQAD